MKSFNNLSLWDYKEHFTFYEQVKILIGCYVVFTFINHAFENISVSFLFSLFLSYLFFYYSFEKKYQSKQEINQDLKQKLTSIKTSKLNLIYNDLEALNLYSSLIEFRDYNNTEFIKSMKHYNNFLEITLNITNNALYTGDYLDLAESEAKKALNSLASISLSLPNKYLVINENDTISISIKLEQGVTQLAEIIDKNLYDIYQVLHRKWQTEEINYNSKPVFYSPVEKNMLHTREYSKNYSLY